MPDFLKKYLFIGLLLTFISNCLAQDFSYFTIGEETLKNAEIYSILQTDDLRLYVATNEGLYQYKHGVMKPIASAQEQKGISLFNLRANSKGDVFCYNLTGQIFRIEKNLLKLYAQIPAKYMASHMGMEFDNEDNLIVKAKGCYILTPSSIETIVDGEKLRMRGLSKLPDGRIFIARAVVDTLYQIKNGAVLRIPSPYRSNGLTASGFHYILGEKLVLSDSLNVIRGSKFQDNPVQPNTKYVQFDNRIIWRKKNKSGLETLGLQDQKIRVTNEYFKDIFISEIVKGKYGELFVGTFGKGLIVVPNQKVIQHDLKGYGNNIQSMFVDENNALFLMDRTHGILKYTANKIEKIEAKFRYSPEKIFGLKNKSTPLAQDNSHLVYNNGVVNGALKNVSDLDENTYLLSTSLGVYKMGPTQVLQSDSWSKYKNSSTVYFLKNIRTRCSDAIYAPSEKALYVSTISSLIRVSNNGEKKSLQYKGRDIVANDLLLFKNQIWAATQNNGVLIFENGRVIKRLNQEQKTKINYVNKLEQKNGSIFISHKTGFKIYNTKDSSWSYIGIAEGIENGSIHDFAVGKKELWFHSNNKVLSMPIDNIPDLKAKFKTHIDSVLVSDQHITLSENKILNYTNNKLEIHLDFRGVTFEKEAFYTYQLLGFDNAVKRTNVTQPTITYNYLPPGNYSFKLQTNYRNITSPPKIYSFEIKKPFWQTWWFYIFTTLCIALIVILYNIFKNKKLEKQNRIKLEQQTLKTNYLESELKALRSQMNPHFIFNSLNSIQDLILKQDTDASYDYIVLFSDLVRNSLIYSDQGYITLEKEIEFLETYLKLEKLRFGDTFEYTIETENIDIKLPSLVIQPFVENAIVHGLFHKKGKKELSIDLKNHPAGLQCTITDNGIGREKASEIQKRQGSYKKSFALETIQKRLEILSEKYDMAIGFDITDLKEKNKAIGTKVIIILPDLNR